LPLVKVWPQTGPQSRRLGRFLRWHSLRDSVAVLWFGPLSRSAATGDYGERKKETRTCARYTMTARKSRNGESVSARTLARQDACHGLKAAEAAPRGGHSLQCLSALLGAPRGQWRAISFPDGSAKNRSRPHSFAHFLEAQKVSLTASPESIKNQRGRESIKNCRPKERIKNWRGGESIKNWRGRERIKNWHGRESIKNWRGELAMFIPRKCNDQNTLWQGGSLIRMPHQIRDADSWAAVRSGCLIR